MPQSLRIGTLGAARITPMALIAPAKRVDDVEVVSVAARDPARAKKFATKHHIPRVAASYDELLSDPDVDAIYNPLPNSLHAEWTIKALRAGKHVLCEKPFTSNADEAEQVRAEAARSTQVVMEAFHYRYHPLSLRTRELTTGGELGSITRVETAMCIPLPLPGDIRYRLDLAGGATMDTGCYAVHRLRTFSGEEPHVVSAAARLASEGVDRFMQAEFGFENGATGQMTCSLWSSKLVKIGARIELEGGEVKVRNPVVPQFFHSFKWRRTGESAWRKERFDRTPTYTYQLTAFRDAVMSGTAFPTNIDDAIRNMQVIDAVYRAAGLEPRGQVRR